MKKNGRTKVDKKVKVKERKTDKKGFKLSLFSMLILISLLPVILSVAVMSSTSLVITQNNLEDGAENTLYIVANNLASYCHENQITAVTAQNYFEYLDSLKNQDIEMAIIIEGAPCATSIKNANDYRIREIEVEKDINSPDMQNGFYDKHVEINENVYYGYYMPISADGKIIGTAFAGKLQDNVTGDIKSIVIIFITIAVILVVVFTVVALLCSRGLVKSVSTVAKNVNALSNGDLTKQNVRASSVKEMNKLLRETQSTQQNLSDTIGKVKDVSQKLVGNVNEVTALSESTSGRAQHITSSMRELSEATISMAENVQDINVQMLEIGNCVNDITGSVDHLYSSSENIQQTSTEAKGYIEAIMQDSNKSVEAVNDIATQIKETNASIARIDEAVALILSISTQTNLLSLNASIEAARVGSLGRGFAVVAEEIRNLAEQSADGAEMIKNLAGTIMQNSKESVKRIEAVRSLIMQEQENVLKTQRKYEELSNDIELSVAEIKAIAEKTENLSDYKEHIIENVQGLSAISEENTASNEEVSANIMEIVEEVQLVNDNCEKMNHMAGELEESVAYFNN